MQRIDSTSLFNSPEINKHFGYRQQMTRLYNLRCSSKEPSARLRLFQLIADYQYQFANPSLFTNKKILLHATKAGGLGDVAHAFQFEETLRQVFATCEIEIKLYCPLGGQSDEQTVKDVFPNNGFTVSFLSQNYSISDLQLSQVINSADCVIGAGVPIARPLLSNLIHSSFREYGFSSHPNIKERDLSMGFNPMEEGLNFPSLTNRALHELNTPWLTQACQHQLNQRLYLLYMPDQAWATKILGLYCIAKLAKDEMHDIDVFLPFKQTLEQLISWGALNANILQEAGIGRIIHLKKRSHDENTDQVQLYEEECRELGTGKTLRIFSGLISNHDMKILEEHSQPFLGCTGNMSLSSAFVRGKIPFYFDTGLFGKILGPWNEEIKKMGLTHLATFHDLIIEFDRRWEAINAKHTPPVKNRFWQPPPCVDFNIEHSVPRRTITDFAQILPEYAEKFTALVSDQLLTEAQAFSAHVTEHFDVKPRLISTVYRGLVIKQHPNMLAVESELWHKFQKNEIDERQLVDEMSQALQNLPHINSTFTHNG